MFYSTFITITFFLINEVSVFPNQTSKVNFTTVCLGGRSEALNFIDIASASSQTRRSRQVSQKVSSPISIFLVGYLRRFASLKRERVV